MTVYIEGAEIRRVREQLGEDQTAFGKRFNVVRRTVIRWEQRGHYFSAWRRYDYQKRRDLPSEADGWEVVGKTAAARAANAKAAAARRRKNSLRQARRKSPAGNRARRRKPVTRRARAARARRVTPRRGRR